jgi:hypothetical protein
MKSYRWAFLLYYTIYFQDFVSGPSYQMVRHVAGNWRRPALMARSKSPRVVRTQAQARKYQSISVRQWCSFRSTISSMQDKQGSRCLYGCPSDNKKRGKCNKKLWCHLSHGYHRRCQFETVSRNSSVTSYFRDLALSDGHLYLYMQG